MQRQVNMTMRRRPVAPAVDEIASVCVMIRIRRISRIVTADYEAVLRPLGIGAAQFALLVAIGKLQPASRAAIGRDQHQDRSTLTRNLKLIIDKGWAEETAGSGRSRPVRLTDAGAAVIHRALPAWRAAQAQAARALGPEGMALIDQIEKRLLDGS